MRIVQVGLLAGTVLAGLSLPGRAAASPYDSADDLWERYVRMVGQRDEVEVLACYHEDFRKQLAGDKTSAGRARLSVHMADMFELLQRDYDYTVVEEKERAGKTIYTIKFVNRKKHNEHLSTVEFAESDGRWWITKSPDLPQFLSAGKGTFTMIAGILIAVVAIGLVVKKAFGG